MNTQLFITQSIFHIPVLKNNTTSNQQPCAVFQANQFQVDFFFPSEMLGWQNHHQLLKDWQERATNHWRRSSLWSKGENNTCLRSCDEALKQQEQRRKSDPCREEAAVDCWVNKVYDFMRDCCSIPVSYQQSTLVSFNHHHDHSIISTTCCFIATMTTKVP